MNWVDLVIIVVLAGAIILESRRGFGRAVFDFIAVIVAARLSYMLTGTFSDTVQFSEAATTNEAMSYAVLFVAIGGVLLFVSKLVYDTTLVSAETFDMLLGTVCGVGVGITLCHVFVRAIALDMGLDVPTPVLVRSAFGMEFLTFESYHNVVETLYNLGQTD